MIAKIQIQAQSRTMQERARNIKKSLGVKVAAKYLKARGWSVEAALFVLLGV